MTLQQRLQIFPQRTTQVFAFQREFHGCLQKTQLVAGIVTFALKCVRVHLLAFQQSADSIREL